jgi:ribosomal protein L14
MLTLFFQTLLTCIDNSGASVVECVNVLKKKRPATIGQSPNPRNENQNHAKG